MQQGMTSVIYADSYPRLLIAIQAFTTYFLEHSELSIRSEPDVKWTNNPALGSWGTYK